MNLPLPRSLRAIACLLALGVTSAAAPAALAATPAALTLHTAAAQNTRKLTVDITTTGGTVWGTVSVRYTYDGHTVLRSAGQATSTFSVPRGVTVHLTQKPLDAITWPFEQWTIVRGAQTLNRSAASTAIKVNGNVQVTAVYFFN